MALVDLRGRERDAEVCALLEVDPAWNLVGWSRDGALVACAAFERLSDDAVAVRAVAGRDDEAARSLLRAVAEVATAARLVAVVDDRTSSVFEDAGFISDRVDPGRLALTLTEAPATTDAVRATSLGEIETAIRDAWGRETSDDPEEWSEANPARGQCAVSALVVRELLGGEILVANVLRDGRRSTATPGTGSRSGSRSTSHEHSSGTASVSASRASRSRSSRTGIRSGWRRSASAHDSVSSPS